MSTPEWETSKENVAPIASGRNVETLNNALTADTEVLNSTRTFHESAIRDAANGIGPFADDPLSPWVNYTKWVIDNFPRGSNLIVAIVEGACRRFSKDPRYRDDRRFVRLWIRYADLRTDKADVFQYMQKHHIGEHAALFYEAWATTLELARDYDKAEEIYKLGVQINAEPTDRLQQRLREYYNRMAARARRTEKKAKAAQIRKEEAEKARKTRASRGEPTLADNILSRPDTAHDEITTNDENSRSATAVRPALGSLTERQATTGLRPMESVSRMKPPVLGERPRPIERGDVRRGNKSRKGQNEKIEIYNDSHSTAASASGEHKKILEEQEDFPFAPLAKAHEVSKENDGKLPSKWVGETLPQNAAAQKNLNRGMRSTAAPIQIYQEPDVSEVEEIPAQSGNAAASSVSREVTEHPQSPVSACRSAGSFNPNSPTINTRIAMQEIDDSLNSSLLMERERDRVLGGLRSGTHGGVIAVERPQQNARIEIFRDGDEADKENAHRDGPARNNSIGPTANMWLEHRVLQSIPELEGPLIHRIVDEDDENIDPNMMSASVHPAALPPQSENIAPADGQEQQREHVAIGHPVQASDMEQDSLRQNMEDICDVEDGGDDGANELLDFLTMWIFKEPGYFIIDGEDPEIVKNGMFQFHPRGKEIASFNVDTYLWEGYGNESKVVVVDDSDNMLGLRDQEEMDDYAENLLAMKVYNTANRSNVNESSGWLEFFMYRTLCNRYGSPIPTIPTALAYFEGTQYGYLLLDRVCSATLKECIISNERFTLTEVLVMYLVADLLRSLETVHTVGIIHSDVTLDNVLYRNDPEEGLVEDRYMASDPGSWAAKGILLIDFNHAVDTQRVSPDGNMDEVVKHMSKHGNTFLQEDYRIPNASEWGFNIDCYCAAVCAAKMLKLDGPMVNANGGGLEYAEVWDVFFQGMVKLGAKAKAAETVDTMRRCREMMEGALVENSGLKLELLTLSSITESKAGGAEMGL